MNKQAAKKYSNADQSHTIHSMNDSRIQRSTPILIMVILPIVLLAALLFLSACFSRDQGAQDIFEPYRIAVKDEYQDHFEDLEMAPRYAIDMTLGPDSKIVTGTETVHFYNTSSDPWPHVVFRLYPVLSHYGGNMTIHRVLVNGQPATYTYQANHTAMRIDLMDVLLPNRGVEIELGWRLMIPTWPDTTNVYALFGKSQGMVSLPLFYPTLAVYQPEREFSTATQTDGWWIAEGNSRGDSAFNLASLFVVTTTLPANHVPVTSGTLITSTLIPATKAENNYARHVWATGPSREFVLHTSPLFQSRTTEVYGTRITSYWLPGHEAGGTSAMNYMAAALRVYHDLYGPYPYRDMRVAPAPLGLRGMEYPQVNLLGPLLYDEYRQNLEILVAHEVAHQWWYQMVHNDPVHEPWLDEALAEFSVKLYYDALRGQTGGSKLQTNRWQAPLATMKQREQDTMINQPVDSFASSKQYETIIYAKGALFYENMYNLLGKADFQHFLQTYVQNYRYQIVDTQSWLDTIGELENPDLTELYQDWIEGKKSIQFFDEDDEEAVPE